MLIETRKTRRLVDLLFHLPIFSCGPRKANFLAFASIFLVITLASLPTLRSGERLNLNDDFFQYASRYEAVRKSLFEYHSFPLRSHWLGGGYPTLGDPEDPTLNPLAILPILFGTVFGLKLISYLAFLVAGLATYALARHVLGYTWWGAIFSALVFGTSLFVPLRLEDGNPNEVYAAFLPLCLLLIGRGCRRQRFALPLLVFVFYTMLSDGKLACLMAMFYLGVICLLQLVPMFRTFSLTPIQRIVGHQPMLFLLIALGLTLLVGMVRILPALELIQGKGGLAHIDLYYHPKTYDPAGVFAYTWEQLWQESVGWGGRTGLVTIGWLPVVLTGIALVVFWRNALPWGISLVLFAWLLLAYNAPFDLLKWLWHLPIFSANYRPYKYFSFQIAFTFAIASGQSFHLLRRLRPRLLEPVLALALIIFSVGFLLPEMVRIQRETYTLQPPQVTPTETFFQIQGRDLARSRAEPFQALTYFNVLRNVGTIDWYTGIPLPEHAIPKYFVDSANEFIPNPDYRGEVTVEGTPVTSSEASRPVIGGIRIRPNTIQAQVHMSTPGIVVINQNYHRDWHTNHGKLIDHQGLLGIELAGPGEYDLHLRYHPRSFYIGLAISVLSLVGLVGYTQWYTSSGIH